MNSEQSRLEKVLQYFLENHCDDPINGTKFDSAVIDAIRELQGRFGDSPRPLINKECLDLGFVIQDNSGIAGCSTVPCFGGKMPYQSEPTVGCAIGRTMCDESPVQSMRTAKAFGEINAKLKEQQRLERNAAARKRYVERKQMNLYLGKIWNKGGRGNEV